MNRFFKGYYFKCSTNERTIACIPALHCDGRKRSASLQVITNERAYQLDFLDAKLDRGRLRIQMGDNFFSEKGMELSSENGNLSIKGKVVFGPLQRLKYDIMGPFALVPFMQCRHEVVSMYHTVTGKIRINGEQYVFDRGRGYVEGDRGRSFPEEYLWTQCHFGRGSLMMSVAKIPFCGGSFWGTIGVVMLDGREYRFATYLGARIFFCGKRSVVIRQGDYELAAKLLEPSARTLRAPVKGKMKRRIRESVECGAYYRLSCRGKNLLEFTSRRASFEYEFY